MLSHGHGRSVVKIKHQRGRNSVVIFQRFKTHKMSVYNQFFQFGMIVEVHTSIFFNFFPLKLRICAYDKKRLKKGGFYHILANEHMRRCAYVHLRLYLKFKRQTEQSSKNAPKNKNFLSQIADKKQLFRSFSAKPKFPLHAPENPSQNFGFRTRSAHSLSFFDTLINLKKFKNKYFRNVKKYKQKKKTPVCTLKRRQAFAIRKPNRDLA